MRGLKSSGTAAEKRSMLQMLRDILRKVVALGPLAVGVYLILDARMDLAYELHEWNTAQVFIGVIPIGVAGWLVCSRPKVRAEAADGEA